jgi:hypothetical protein
LAILVALLAAQILRDRWLQFVQRPILGFHPWPFAKPLVYALLILAVIVFDKESQAFVYFQF